MFEFVCYLLLCCLFFSYEFVGDVEVAIEVEACLSVVEVGAGLAFVEELQCSDGFDVQPLGKLYGNGAYAVAQDNLLHDW